ncbi:hypothetical protein [uncultured Shimia sp.]|uniref:hypothetical protein n=1 Tax=uncultured Shimia sp. TaxID=573152 RepID=UPI002601B748|nr:hypothetical protein [uncultured Shimia sp.]
MRKIAFSLAIAAIVLSACSTRLNPRNWFGNSQEVATGSTTERNPLIPEENALATRPEEVYPGVPVQKVTELVVERLDDGALIRASGVAYVQGAFSVKLQPLNEGKPENGVLTYELLAVHPSWGTRGGTDQARTVTVAHNLTDQQLEGVRTIKVVAADNARQARRR